MPVLVLHDLESSTLRKLEMRARIHNRTPEAEACAILSVPDGTPLSVDEARRMAEAIRSSMPPSKVEVVDEIRAMRDER